MFNLKICVDLIHRTKSEYEIYIFHIKHNFNERAEKLTINIRYINNKKKKLLHAIKCCGF